MNLVYQAEEELRLLGVRFDWLERKLGRIQLTSNGRERVIEEMNRLLVFGIALKMAADGELPPKRLPQPQSARERRVWDVLLGLYAVNTAKRSDA